MKEDVRKKMREWWIGELRSLTEKVQKEEEKRQNRERTKAEKLLGEYRTYADAQDAYGCGVITERQFDRIVDLLEKANPMEDDLYRAKMELLQEIYREQKALLSGEPAPSGASGHLADDVRAGLRQCIRAVDVTDCHGCPFRSDGWFGVGCRQDLMRAALALVEGGRG